MEEQKLPETQALSLETLFCLCLGTFFGGLRDQKSFCFGFNAVTHATVLLLEA